MRNEKGFTLIELVVVIVILGILAATALPRFVDLKGDAAQAAIQGAAGALTSSMTINYATFSVRTSSGSGITRLSTTNACAAMTGGMTAWDSAKFSIQTDGSCATSTAGQTASCTLRHADDSTKSAVATIICTG